MIPLANVVQSDRTELLYRIFSHKPAFYHYYNRKLIYFIL